MLKNIIFVETSIDFCWYYEQYKSNIRNLIDGDDEKSFNLIAHFDTKKLCLYCCKQQIACEKYSDSGEGDAGKNNQTNTQTR